MRPEEKQKALARSAKWVSANRDRVRELSRQHYKKHAVEKNKHQPWRNLLIGTARRAKINNLPFELTDAWAKARWTGYCELTGIPFASPEQRTGYKNRNFSPSIDKIIPTLGYTVANSRIILWAINSLKRDGTDEQMYCIAKALIEHRPRHAERILSLPA